MARRPGPCKDCEKPQPKLSRDRCPTCYSRWLKAQKRAGTFVKGSSKPSLRDRFESKLSPQPNGCIHWTGAISKVGYGQTSDKGVQRSAHRVAYELFVGPIPDGICIDHACHNGDTTCAGGNDCLHRRCVNPAHLEPATPRENQHRSHLTFASRDTCMRGHAFTEENTYLRPDGKGRQCRQCTSTRIEKARKAKAPRRRLKQCRRGHPMTEENTYVYGNRRICRQCRRDADKVNYLRQKGNPA